MRNTTTQGATVLPKGLIRTPGLLYVLGLAIWLSTYLISEGFFNDDTPQSIIVLRLFSLYLMLLNEISSKTKYFRHDYLGILVIVVAAISSYVSGRTNLLFAVMVIFFGRTIDFKLLAKTCLIVTGFWLLLIVVCSLSGIIDQNFVNAGGRMRSSLGFTWPSRPQNYFLTICMLIVYLYSSRIKLLHIALLVGIATWMFSITDSRSPYYFTILLFSMVLFRRFEIVHFCRIGWRGIIVPLFVWSATLTFLASILYDASNPVMQSANTLFSNRLAYSHNAFSGYPITLFGSEVFGSQNDAWFSSYVDSAYMNLLFTYGLLVLIAITVGLTRLMEWAFLEKNDSLIICLIIAALHGIPEAQLIMVQYTPFLLLIPHAIEQLRGKRGLTIAKGMYSDC